MFAFLVTRLTFHYHFLAPGFQIEDGIKKAGLPLFRQPGCLGILRRPVAFRPCLAAGLALAEDYSFSMPGDSPQSVKTLNLTGGNQDFSGENT
jgi:hypothetical protein